MKKQLNRRQFIKLSGLAGGALTLSGATFLSNACTARSESRKPNIIYIMADDLGYGDLGCYGQEKIKTPHLDRMASEGMRFTQHYAGSTVCAPSRCSLMTGLHTGHCEIRGNREAKPEGQLPLSQGTVTVASLLKAAGYITGAIGKWGLGSPGSDGDPNMQGFDYFFGYNCQREAHFFYPQHLWKNQEKLILQDNAEGKKQTYSHDLIADDALNFIDKNKNENFFLYLPFTIPHAELAVPQDSLKEYTDQFDDKPYPGGHYGAQEKPRAAYAAMVSRMDRDIGRILEKLKKLGLDEHTIVIFTSDNGPHREGGNDPEFFNSNAHLRGIKRDVYEGGIRVPLIARWPGKIKAGAVSEHVSAFWDFLPTACDLAGLPAPTSSDGISYFPEMTGTDQPKHDYLYWEFHEKGGRQAVRLGDWKGVRMDIRKGNLDIELYNLAEDPSEKNNIAEHHPDIVNQIEKILKEARVPSEHFPLKELDG